MFNVNTDKHPNTTLVETADKCVMAIKDKIESRLRIIAEKDIPVDSKLLEYGALLRCRNISLLDIGLRKVFRVCANCSSHQVQRKRVDNSPLCQVCRKNE